MLMPHDTTISADQQQTEPAPLSEAHEQLSADIVKALKTVYDPEIPADIYELGLIYAIDFDAAGVVKVEMTLTAPACPSAQELPEQVRNAVLAVPGVTAAKVETVWEPPWDKERMSEVAKLQLGFF